MGIQGKDNLIAFAKTAALASTAFDLPAEQISEDLGKIANVYKIPIRNIEQLGDVINYLDDNAQSKGADIINVMQRIAGSTGSMNFKEAAALGSTFLSLGASPEVAATATKAMVRELLIAEKQPKRFQKGLKELGLSAKQIQADMARDSTGTIIKVMEAVNKLPKTKQMGVMVDMFGKEYGDDAAKLADNLGEYRKQLGLVNEAKSAGSMGREGDAKNDTLSAQWQMSQNKLFNQSSELGQNLRQPLMEAMSLIGSVLERISAWTKANPELTAALVKVGAVLGVVMVALGGLMLAIAGIAGPFIAARFAMAMFGIQLTSGVGIIGRLGSAIQFGGGLLKGFFTLLRANPFFALAAFLSGFVMHFTTNWDRLKQMWTQGDWRGIGVFILQGLEAGLNAMTMGLYGTIKRIISGVISLVMDIFGIHSPSRVFAQIGEYLMAGLVNGIASGLASVKKVITGAGESAIGWMKEKLGIHSPSRVFAELGGFTMEGFTNGIANGAAGPLDAIKAMGQKLTPAGAGLALGTASMGAGAMPIDNRPPITAGAPATQAAPAAPINLTIHAAPGMNERELARFVMQQIDQAQRQQAATRRSRLTDGD
ncbi:phage tail tape measure protein [Laribacter hongkongensis]|uniref:phage tail tape measure protein n=1 Tax=Laribacter hongkongensis TaxID=168471 RepID=UPI001EFD23B8|nr:phage tail tape measure protein [Laribacter hongkongensis]MCG9079935.1 phage tail tape measure protein [Laribacter hongkongensis]